MKKWMILIVCCIVASLKAYAQDSITINSWRNLPKTAIAPQTEVIKQDEVDNAQTVYIVEKDTVFEQRDASQKTPQRSIVLALKDSISWKGRRILRIDIYANQKEVDNHGNEINRFSSRDSIGYEYYPSIRWSMLAVAALGCVIASLN